MSSKTLTATLKFNTKQAESSLKKVDRLINNINRGLSKTKATNLEKQLSRAGTQATKLRTKLGQVNASLNKGATQAGKISTNLRKAKTAQDQVTEGARKANAQFSKSNNLLGSMGSKLKMLASTYLGIMGMKAAINTSDTITKAQNKLNNLNGGDTALTQQQMDKMYASANKVRMSYTDMLSNASKSMTLAPDAFQGNIDNAIRFQEIMAESYALGGASAAETSSSMYQMIQALGAGTLAGDELRSVREGAPLAYKAIEEFAQGVYGTTDSLKDMASQGLITSEMVVAAIMDSGSTIDEQFQNTAMTFEQAWDRIKNYAVKAFEPVSNALNEMLNRAVENGVFEKIEQAFVALGNVILDVFDWICNAVQWVANNWEWLKHLLIAGLILYATYLIITTAIAIKEAYARIAAWLAEYGAAMLTIGAILVGVYLLIQIFQAWKQGTVDTCNAIALALLVVAAVCFVIFGWQVALVIAIIAVIVWAFEYVCWLFGFLAAVIVDILSFIWNVIWWVIQAVVTAVVWLGATILNFIIGVINAIIQFIWARFVVPFINIIEWILNVCNGGFDSFGGAVANLVGNIIGWFLSLGQVVTKIIDAIFGTNWTGGLEALKSKVISWGKNENSITLSREAPTINRIDTTNVAGAVWDGMDGLHTGYANPLNWGSSAMNWGSSVKGSVNDWGSQFQTGNSDGLLGLNLDNVTGTSGLPSANDPAYDVAGAYDMPKNLKETADNTGAIADSMELAEEDLEYLRKLADMEWKKEYTTANITVDMSNYNTIYGDNDLDGIFTKLSDKLIEELNINADGVYV